MAMLSSLNLMFNNMTNKKKKVLIGCSGGPDSMALLDMSKDKYDVYCAHVNYHKRKSANRDERIVKDYCLKNKIPFYSIDYKDKAGGNFQDKARVFRYGYFSKLIKELNLDMVLVAHHKDDLIETYFLQERRGSKPNHYGLKRSVKISGVKVYRPLLKYSKQNLLDYCDKNLIPYGIDESNLTDDYTRNKIRHQIVEKMSNKDKQYIIKEINRKNKENADELKKAKAFLNKRNKVSIKEFNDYDNKELLLSLLLNKQLSNKEVKEIIRQIKEAKSFEILIDDYYLVKEYDYIEVYKKDDDYQYTLNNLKYFKTKHFKTSKIGGNKEGVSIKKEDFPLTIRNYQNGDFIVMKYGKKKLNRFFIDNKIPSKMRKTWPVLLNNDGDIVLVPGIGCDLFHYSKKHNLYMIKL